IHQRYARIAGDRHATRPDRDSVGPRLVYAAAAETSSFFVQQGVRRAPREAPPGMARPRLRQRVTARPVALDGRVRCGVRDCGPDYGRRLPEAGRGWGKPRAAQANSSLITRPLLAIFMGRLFLLVKVVSSEMPSALRTEAIRSSDL